MRNDYYTNTVEDAADFERRYGPWHADDRDTPDAGDLADLARDMAATRRENAAYTERRDKVIAEGGWMPTLRERDEALATARLIGTAHAWSVVPEQPWYATRRDPLPFEVDDRCHDLRVTCTREGVIRIDGVLPERLDDVVALIDKRATGPRLWGYGTIETAVVDGVVWIKCEWPAPEQDPPF